MVIEFPLFPFMILIFYTFFQPLKIADILFTLQMIWQTSTLILILPFDLYTTSLLSIDSSGTLSVTSRTAQH